MSGGGPKLYSIAAHRGFADALAAGLLPRYRDDSTGLARVTLLLPSSRAARAVTEAFVRLSGDGLLLPRMAVIGDLDLVDTLGPLFDPIGGEAADAIPPAVSPTYRWLRLAELLEHAMEGRAPQGAGRLRLARRMGEVMDRLLVEDIAPDELMSERVIEIVGELAEHWQDATRSFARLQALWLAELEQLGRVDAATRRNRLFAHLADRWRAAPPAHPVIAAGVTSAAPALARLLRVVSELPDGAVILPDLGLSLDGDVWDDLGRAGVGETPADLPFAASDAVTHPQYHLKLLLNRMGVARDEVQPWHRAGMSKGPPARSHALSALFLPPAASAGWVDLPPDKRRLSGVRIMRAETPEEEAQAIALLIREALTEPAKRVALVTPDRGLARRVVAHCERWNIAADDSAGRSLARTPAGRVLLLLAEVASEQAAPVPLTALLGHPLVARGDERPQWPIQLRRLERRLRGPRRAPGLAAYTHAAAVLREDERFADWWDPIEALLGDLLGAGEDRPLADWLDRLVEIGEALAGLDWWAREDGRALAAFLEDLRDEARAVGTRIALDELPVMLREAMQPVAVRPPYGGHPRVAVLGLLEARMVRADLMICAGMNEGTWPAAAALDPVLPPPVLRALGVPGADFRIGLAAHDLAGALGAPEVVLSRATRDAGGPTIPSRFLLRVEALMGEKLLRDHRETRAIALARALASPESVAPHPRPQPLPSPEQRRVRVSVTQLDRLRSDPYQFYASKILGLGTLDPIDAEPTPAWQGKLAHAILEAWHKGEGMLPDLTARELQRMGAHPLVRALWRPRLEAALEWAACMIAAQSDRAVAVVEGKGLWDYRGVTIHGRADRIDRHADGTLAIIDYKTGRPPSGSQVEQGFALQLGTLGLIARESEFRDEAGNTASGAATAFEYWSLARDAKSATGFGFVQTPLHIPPKRSGIAPADFLPAAQRFLDDALDRWILGTEPFTARLNPDQAGYADYDQLMRLGEWLGRESGEAGR